MTHHDDCRVGVGLTPTSASTPGDSVERVCVERDDDSGGPGAQREVVTW
ncbi:MAG: hypothetical protein JO115_00360 [Pseudonocardiales bacterium]|nr:hypothetical protein [Pseudonocardiales bacterium]